MVDVMIADDRSYPNKSVGISYSLIQTRLPKADSPIMMVGVHSISIARECNLIAFD